MGPPAVHWSPMSARLAVGSVVIRVEREVCVHHRHGQPAAVLARIRQARGRFGVERPPGDQARIVLRLLGRNVELRMTLGRFDENRLVEYDSTQSGNPDVHHERHFAPAADGGFLYRLVVEYEPRAACGGSTTVFSSGVGSSAHFERRSRISRLRSPPEGAANCTAAGVDLARTSTTCRLSSASCRL